MKLQGEYNSKVAIIPPLTCGKFYGKLNILHVKMVVEAMHVL
jgi:hypothetical protein